VTRRVIVVDASKDPDEPQPYRMANPEIIWSSEEEREYEEGCLSFPEHFAGVVRPEGIRVRYLDHENEIRELEANGLLATCIQHEMDHLEGVLFVDYLSKLKRDLILRKLRKLQKEEARDAKRDAKREARRKAPAAV
ncbi:MAG: peptide deformylase, partial [Proteobacteria bacterium]|nr:peptide deformylase [Pseudomonadota bacterium]